MASSKRNSPDVLVPANSNTFVGDTNLYNVTSAERNIALSI